MKLRILCLGIVTVLLLAGYSTALSNSGGGNWTYSSEIIIKENSGNLLTDYQISVHLTSDNFDFSRAASDGVDIRFTDIQENELNYWIESWDSDNKNAWIIVRIPSIPARAETKITLHYGNKNAASSGNGRATFVYFDDFETGDLTSYIIERGTFRTSNGMLEGSGNTRARIVLKDLKMRDFAVEAKLLNLASASDPGILFKINKLDYNEYEKSRLIVVLQGGGMLYFGDFDLIRNKIVPLSKGIQNPTKLHNIKVSVYGDDISVWLDRGQEFTTRYDNIDYFEGNFGLRADISNSVVLFDDFRISKYVYPEPSVTVESKSPLGGIFSQIPDGMSSSDAWTPFMFPVFLVVVVAVAIVLIRNRSKHSQKPVKQIQNAVVIPDSFPPVQIAPAVQKIRQWEYEGYDLTSLKAIKDTSRQEYLLRDYEDKISELKKVHAELNAIKNSHAQTLLVPELLALFNQISQDIRNPDRCNEVGIRLISLKKKITEMEHAKPVSRPCFSPVPRLKLRAVVAQFGPEVIDDPRKVKGLLNDYCATGSSGATNPFQKELTVLLSALEYRVPHDILAASKNNMFDIQKIVLKKRLTDHAITEDAAAWAVDTWAEALGI